MLKRRTCLAATAAGPRAHRLCAPRPGRASMVKIVVPYIPGVPRYTAGASSPRR